MNEGEVREMKELLIKAVNTALPLGPWGATPPHFRDVGRIISSVLVDTLS